MIEKHEISVMMRSVARVVKEYVSVAIAATTARWDELDNRIKEIPAGDKGERGEAGERGEPGISIKGDTGEPGAQGPKGDSGLTGYAGPAGQKGDPGESIKGDPGEQGIQGEKGEPGISIQGERGEKGDKGIDGKDAEPIHPDTVSLMVVTEVAKAIAVIPKAENGKDGSPGRDALEIEILPRIDMEKSYPRGTYARYCGGIVRAMRTTNPKGPILADWEIIVAGISAVTVIQGEDPREMSIDCCLTTGDHAASKFYVPMLLYRDIYRAGDTYTKGDVVTWDGSAWHCIADSTKSAPGVTPSAWRLIVKRGRDAKDGNDGKIGPQGPAGPSGRDLTQMSYDGEKH